MSEEQSEYKTDTKPVAKKATKKAAKKKASSYKPKGIGPSTQYERERRDRAMMIFLRNIAAVRGLDYRGLLDGIVFDTPDNLDEWEKQVKILEKTLPFDFSKPYEKAVIQAKAVEIKKGETVIPMGRGGFHTDKDGKEVMITNGRVLRFLAGAWRDTGAVDKHPSKPFTKAEGK